MVGRSRVLYLFLMKDIDRCYQGQRNDFTRTLRSITVFLHSMVQYTEYGKRFWRQHQSGSPNRAGCCLLYLAVRYIVGGVYASPTHMALRTCWLRLPVRLLSLSPTVCLAVHGCCSCHPGKILWLVNNARETFQVHFSEVITPTSTPSPEVPPRRHPAVYGAGKSALLAR